jgi:hypothetical protein
MPRAMLLCSLLALVVLRLVGVRLSAPLVLGALLGPLAYGAVRALLSPNPKEPRS